MGGVSTYRFVCALHNPYLKSQHYTPSKSLSEHTQPPKQPARANASGLCVGGCVWFADVRDTTKRGYGCASVAVRVEKRANKNVKIRLLFSETETAKQNQKFPFHCLGRFAAEGWGEETQEKCKEIFWFLHTRVRERVRGALYRFPAQSERTRQFQATTRSARANQSSSGFRSKYIRTLSNTHRITYKVWILCIQTFCMLPVEGDSKDGAGIQDEQ